ncbi:YunG family protein [Yinghuangia seranimata]|uniref:YunG family protein n=1 Tax=Yinghuangia seranimata TaxID=408067 RepID=UPI00248BB31F|nr:hypothetical protein [Yinghuangia seranimata]MDI2125760.1 hypothetical protein [Yinghuangia seranimata]
MIDTLPEAEPTPPAPLTLAAVERALRASWAADTCSPDDLERAPWLSGNPAWGHCDITTLVVHDLFGGELMLGSVELDGRPRGYHWWNRLSSGVELDMTHEQFVLGEQVVGGRAVERPSGPLKVRADEYALLRVRVGQALGRTLPPSINLVAD